MNKQSPRYLGHSHEGKYSYWSFPDQYVYQMENETKRWIGWLCSFPAWERTFANVAWITLAQEAA